MGRRSSPRDCARALWLLGIEPPVTPAQLQAAYRARIAQAHPDLHLDSEARTEAANVLSRALNEARDLVAEWIAADRSWPALAGAPPVPRSPRARAGARARRDAPRPKRHRGRRRGGPRRSARAPRRAARAAGRGAPPVGAGPPSRRPRRSPRGAPRGVHQRLRPLDGTGVD